MRATNFILSIRRLETLLVYLWFHMTWQSLTLLQICFFSWTICPDFFYFSVVLFLICLVLSCLSFLFVIDTPLQEDKFIYITERRQLRGWSQRIIWLSIIIHSLILLLSLYYDVWCHEAPTYFFLKCTDAFFNLPDLIRKILCANNKIE